MKKADFHRLKVQPGTRTVSSEGLPAIPFVCWQLRTVFLLFEHVRFRCNPRIGIVREMAKACWAGEQGSSKSGSGFLVSGRLS